MEEALILEYLHNFQFSIFHFQFSNSINSYI